MRRSSAWFTLVLALAAGAALALVLVFDPFELFTSQRGAGPDAGAAGMPGASPRLTGAPRAPEAFPREVNGEPVGLLRLTLGSGTLSGQVTGEGAPLARARVAPVLPHPFGSPAVRTGKEGRWEIRGLPE